MSVRGALLLLLVCSTIVILSVAEGIASATQEPAPREDWLEVYSEKDLSEHDEYMHLGRMLRPPGAKIRLINKPGMSRAVDLEDLPKHLGDLEAGYLLTPHPPSPDIRKADTVEPMHIIPDSVDWPEIPWIDVDRDYACGVRPLDRAIEAYDLQLVSLLHTALASEWVSWGISVLAGFLPQVIGGATTVAFDPLNAQRMHIRRTGSKSVGDFYDGNLSKTVQRRIHRISGAASNRLSGGLHKTLVPYKLRVIGQKGDNPAWGRGFEVVYGPWELEEDSSHNDQPEPLEGGISALPHLGWYAGVHVLDDQVALRVVYRRSQEKADGSKYAFATADALVANVLTRYKKSAVRWRHAFVGDLSNPHDHAFGAIPKEELTDHHEPGTGGRNWKADLQSGDWRYRGPFGRLLPQPGMAIVPSKRLSR